MNIKATWTRPIKLEVVNDFYSTDLEEISNKAGCYIFYNKHGRSLTILYIGRAINIRRRLEQQFNNLNLMNGIRKSLSGTKYLMYCEIQGNRRSGLNRLESQLIKAASMDGHSLINENGIKVFRNQLTFKGNRDSENLFGRGIEF